MTVSDDAQEEVEEDGLVIEDGLVTEDGLMTDSMQESKKEHDRGRTTKIYH